MYGLPKEFDGKFLVGRTLEMVCFNQNQVYLHFDAKVTITVESAFSHQGARGEAIRLIELPVEVSDLMVLLESSVSDVEGSKDGTLSLFFDNGHILRIYDDSPQYESYKIENGDAVIIV